MICRSNMLFTSLLFRVSMCSIYNAKTGLTQVVFDDILHPHPGPESPDVIIVDDDLPSPLPSVATATRQQHRQNRTLQPQNHPPLSLFQRGPTPVILPLPGNGMSGGMLLMQPARMMTPVQVVPPPKMIPVVSCWGCPS